MVYHEHAEVIKLLALYNTDDLQTANLLKTIIEGLKVSIDFEWKEFQEYVSL